MILKAEFLHMIDKLGLEDAELTIAELVWHRCERAMQGLPTQEAVLLTKQSVFTPARQPNALTREETQFLVDLHSDFLRISQDNMKNLTETIQEAWLACNPDDETTAKAFEDLNFLRSYQRKVKSHMRKLEKIQHKLKKLR